ncbi:hypothetical protein ACFX1R_048177 [Malus domestica]
MPAEKHDYTSPNDVEPSFLLSKIPPSLLHETLFFLMDRSASMPELLSFISHICELDWEFNLSSIFVEVDTPLGRCGTRSSVFSSSNCNNI